MTNRLTALAGVSLVLSSGLAFPAEPPLCADAKILNTIRLQYEMAETSAPLKLLEIADAREVLLGPPPASANQYATETTFVEMSRYCEGIARLESGAADPTFWRIDQVKDHAGDYSRVDHCSKRHDVFQDGCAWARPAGDPVPPDG